VGCEGVALVGRESLKLEPAEVVAEVERVDSRSREIHLRPNRERINIVAYSEGARMLYRGREHPVDHLEPGDVVAMHVTEDPPGRYHSDFVSVRARQADRDMAK
jgi:hypothetical protein